MGACRRLQLPKMKEPRKTDWDSSGGFGGTRQGSGRGAVAASAFFILLAIHWSPLLANAPNDAPVSNPSNDLEFNGRVIGERAPARPGEICIVCGKPIGKDDVVYLVNGRRVPLHANVCYARFAADPWKYLALVSPHGAFLGSGGEEAGVSLGWFFFGLYVLVGLLFAALSAQAAVNRGLQPVRWFIAGLALNAVGYLLLLLRTKVPAESLAARSIHHAPVTRSPRACPKCGEPVHPSARRCPNCGAELEPQVASEVQKAGRM